MKYSLILSAVILMSVVGLGATSAVASEVTGSLSTGAQAPAQVGSLTGEVQTPSSAGGGGSSGSNGTALGGGIIGVSGYQGEDSFASLALTPVVNASGSVLGAQTYTAPASVAGTVRAPAPSAREPLAVATLQDTSTNTYDSVASVATSMGLGQWLGGLLLLLILLGLGYYLYTQNGPRARQIP